jgi:coenzyme F420-reducing hydrogenase delta subunit/Pyruvate/2-oxoacid:ferredoxin oxidoreductase delta subunit
MNRIYGSRYNPLYASGPITVGLLVVLLVTGVYLLLFYRIGSPYESVERMTGQAWTGRWIRSLHRYASDAAVVAIAVHAFRMFAQHRSWGPRALAWISGLILLAVLFVSGWTGYVMVWDVQAQLLAVEGARLLDALPVFSEPLGRTFMGDQPLPAAFFFMNMFLHILLPIGMILLLWLHVSRIARPVLLPPKRLTWGLLILLVGISVLWPIGMDAKADLLRLPTEGQLDLFYSFWLPVTRAFPPWVVWVGGSVAAASLLFIPWLFRPAGDRRPPPSVVDERLCTGCEQCYEDCPYEAIAMVARGDDREGLVAVVDPALCVSCGICAGSCAPMGIGPAGRTGRDQLAEVKSFIARRRPTPEDVVVIGCDRSVVGRSAEVDGAAVFGVTCAGNLHTSVVEYLVRAGAGGVLVVACPESDCWNREGARWLEQRLYHDREAELQARVDRRRVRLVHGAAGERQELVSLLGGFRRDVGDLARAVEETRIDLMALCERAPDGDGSRGGDGGPAGDGGGGGGRAVRGAPGVEGNGAAGEVLGDRGLAGRWR